MRKGAFVYTARNEAEMELLLGGAGAGDDGCGAPAGDEPASGVRFGEIEAQTSPTSVSAGAQKNQAQGGKSQGWGLGNGPAMPEPRMRLGYGPNSPKPGMDVLGADQTIS